MKIAFGLLALLAFSAIAGNTNVDLTNHVKAVDGSSSTPKAAPAADTGASVNQKATGGKSQGLSTATDNSAVQTITVKVGDTVSLQLDEPVDGQGLTWDIVEQILGYNKIWTLAEENFVLNQDGKGGVRSFKLKARRSGEETLTLVRGDMTKFDDAQDDYGKSDKNLFNLDLMRAAEFTQIKLKIE